MSWGFVWGPLEHILTIIDTLSEFSFLGVFYRSLWSHAKVLDPLYRGVPKIFFRKLVFWFVVSNPLNHDDLGVGKKIKSKFSNLSPLTIITILILGYLWNNINRMMYMNCYIIDRYNVWFQRIEAENCALQTNTQHKISVFCPIRCLLIRNKTGTCTEILAV